MATGRDVGQKRVTVAVAPADAGARLDAWLAAADVELSRSRAKALILDGRVAVGGRTIVEPKRPVKAGDRVTVDLPPPAPATPEPEAIPLNIVYEDDHLIVLDKPAGLVVHPAAGNRTGTLVNALLAHCGTSLSGIGGVARPGIVHRLDKDTSGLMVVAKTDRAHRALAAQFADHGRTGPLERAYQAIVWGVPARPRGTVDRPLGRAAGRPGRVSVAGPGGRRAVTRYRVLETYGKAAASLVECRLETGRTHQIRVHMAALGHPLIGDRTYGAGFATKANRLPDPLPAIIGSLGRQALHASQLAFAHPDNGEIKRFSSPLSADLSALVAAFKSL